MPPRKTNASHNKVLVPPAHHAEMTRAGRSTGKLSVLCVDDEQEILELEKEMLEHDGRFEVDIVRSAGEAVVAFHHKHYDAVVADYQMPDASGLDLLAELRRNSGIPFILFTGKGREEIAVQAVNSGVDFYVRKGPDFEKQLLELSHKIQQAVEQYNKGEQVKESEEKFRAFADLTYDWVYWVSSDDRYIYMSPSCRRITGYTPQEFYADPGLINRIVLPDDRNLWEKHRTDAEISSGLSSTEFRILTKTGDIRWISHRCQKVFDASRTFLGHLASNIDITDKKHGEIQHYEDEERFRLLYDQAPVAYQSLDAEGRFLTVNREWLETMGYRREEVIGLSFQHFLDPAELKKFQELYRKFKIHGEISGVKFSMIKKDGSKILVRFDGRIGYDRAGNFKQTHCIFANITEQERMERALKESEARLRSIIRVAPIGIGVVVNRIMLEVNDCFCQITGYSRDELIGKSARMLYSGQEEYDFVGRVKYDEIKKTGSGTVETLWKTKDGRIINILLRSTALEPTDLSRGVTFTALDITKRKLAENTLRESEKKYRRIFETVHEGIMTMDENFAATFVNPQMAELLGYTPDEMTGHSVREFMFTEDLFAQAGRMDQRRNGKPEVYEQKFRHRNGSVVWCRVSESPLMEEPDIFRGAFALFSDITEWKRTEQALMESEERFRSIFEKSPTGIALSDTSFRFVMVNPKFCTMLGYPEDELVGKKFSDITHPDYIAADMENIRKLMRGEIQQYTIEKQYLAKNGDTIWGGLARSLIRDNSGSPRLCLAIVEDISDRKKTEHALRRSEENYRQLVENASTLIMKTNIKGEITFFNEYAQKFFGYSEQEILGRRLIDTIVPRTESDTARDLEYIVKDEIVHPEKYFNHENENVRKNGERVWINWRNRPILDAKGTVKGLISFGTDLTERRRAEEALNQANKKLNLLNSITRHDILNQLTALFGYLELSKQADPDETMKGFIDRELMITRAIRMMITFTKDYQDIGLYRPQWQNLGGLVRILAKTMDFGNVSLIINLDNLEIYADPLLEKVIFTLIDNALRHGGSKLTSIRFSYQISPKGCTIFCEDNGDGIRYEERDKIFRKGYGRNTGFGLFLAREILGITKYTLEETGNPGEGARFEIFVPKGSFRVADIPPPS